LTIKVSDAQGDRVNRTNPRSSRTNGVRIRQGDRYFFVRTVPRSAWTPQIKSSEPRNEALMAVFW